MPTNTTNLTPIERSRITTCANQLIDILKECEEDDLRQAAANIIADVIASLQALHVKLTNTSVPDPATFQQQLDRHQKYIMEIGQDINIIADHLGITLPRP